MRIIAFTDIHGSFDAVVRALENEKEFDVIVVGGDLTTYGTPAEARQGIEHLRRFGKPLLVVAGNMDPPGLETEFDTLGVSINARGVVLGSVGFFGVSAAPISRLKTPNEISEEEIARRADAGWKDVAACPVRVFVPHAPPAKTKLDRTFLGLHVGSTAVRQAIERYKPELVLCGHIHEARGVDRIDNSVIVNCGPGGKGSYAVADVGKEIHVELK